MSQVWDLRNQRCLQTLTDTCTYYPENKLSALAYSSDRKLLVSCAYYPKGWNLMDNRHTGGAGHRDPISWVGYNKMFCEVSVLADVQGLHAVSFLRAKHAPQSWHLMAVDPVNQRAKGLVLALTCHS